MDYNKLHNRIDHLLKHETDDFFLNINLKKEVTDKLLDYQYLHVFNLMTSLRDNNCVLDGSQTGCGKTYCSIALCKQLNLKPFIICPKTLIPTWRDVCKYFNIMPLGIVNYETIKLGKWYDKNGERTECKFIKTILKGDDIIGYEWNLPRYSILIFDEAHKCKSAKSQNGKLLLSSKNEYKVLMLSATLSDTPQSFHLFGYMLGFYKTLKQANNWIKGMLLEDGTYTGMKPKLSAINKSIYPKKGSRMTISELGDKFPTNQITANSYYIDTKERNEVNKAFHAIEDNMTKLKSAITSKKGEILTEIMKARQKIEELKVPIFEELANDYLDNGFNVVIFVNYRKTVQQLAKNLKTTCIIQGGQSTEEINENIRKFQANEEKIIICNIAMAEGISLHDLHGVQRISLISPPYSSTKLIQSMGRIARVGAKTPALQRLIFCSNTVEEVICNRIKEKIKFLSKLNDNDLINISNNDNNKDNIDLCIKETENMKIIDG